MLKHTLATLVLLCGMSVSAQEADNFNAAPLSLLSKTKAMPVSEPKEEPKRKIPQVIHEDLPEALPAPKALPGPQSETSTDLPLDNPTREIIKRLEADISILTGIIETQKSITVEDIRGNTLIPTSLCEISPLNHLCPSLTATFGKAGR